MRAQDQFNESKNPVYLYRRNSLYGLSYQIMKKTDDDIVPVGDYAVLDSSEDPKVTEAKLINLVSLMNGHKALLDTVKIDGKSLYFQVVPKNETNGKQKIIFRERSETGVSTENAILLMDEEL